MNPDTGIFVSAYSGDIQQVETNLPVLLHHKCPVVILSPENSPITRVSDESVHCQWMGEVGWAGPQTLVRHRLFLEAMLKFPFQWYLMHDSDSVCLSPEIPAYLYEGKLAWSNEVEDTNPGTSRIRKIAVQPPYFFHRDVLAALIQAADNPPESYYGEITGPIPTQCIDHYHWQLTVGSQQPHFTFHTGCSWETSSRHGLDEMSRVVREHGKVLIHSVKTPYALERLLVEHKEFLRRQR